MSMTSINAIEGRTQDRIRALWGSEGAIAKNALDANTDCQSLLEALKEIGELPDKLRVDDHHQYFMPMEVCADQLQAILDKLCAS